jgi:hypothetical protein
VLLKNSFDLDPAIRELVMRYIPIDRRGEIQPVNSSVSLVRRWLAQIFTFFSSSQSKSRW